jgi:hypothetical protein
MQGERATRATIGTYPSCLARIRLGNVAAQLVLRTQARRKEQGPPHLPRPYGGVLPVSYFVTFFVIL